MSYAKYNNFQKLFNGQNDASKDGLIDILNNQKNNNGIKQTLVNQNKMSFNDPKQDDLNNIQMNRLYIRSRSKENENLRHISGANRRLKNVICSDQAKLPIQYQIPRCTRRPR